MKMNDYQTLIATTRYARWVDEESRRETWSETAQRYVNYWFDGGKITEAEAASMHKAIVGLDVMPSMRAVMTAGKALDRDNVAGFNCSYLPIDHPRSFDELMYILLCGTGVGFSVEKKYVKKLPEVPEEFHSTDTVIVVEDSKIGWAKATKQLIAMLYAGELPDWDVSNVRPAGSRLKTFGGRASGPAPLVELFKFIRAMFINAAGRKLDTLECHDIACKIAEIVVVGGVRRSALISLSDPEDDRMRDAKSGNWWEKNPQRALANNSACYSRKPDVNFFMKEMTSLYESYSGERGIFSREAARNIAARNGRRDIDHDFGCNPCSEILLRPNSFCNLSEVVVRPGDTKQKLKAKIAMATAFGTLQATLTDFRYLRKVWKDNAEDEALLGVSLTGIMDHEVLSGKQGFDVLEKWLDELRETAVQENKVWAERLGIKQAAAITCVKPSGTVSQLCDSASGIHPRFAPYYMRSVRQDNKDPVTDFLKGQIKQSERSKQADFQEGVYTDKYPRVHALDWEPCLHKPDTTTIFSFPMKAPEGSTSVSDVGALHQLEMWKSYQNHFCEHKPSITVYYTEDEFMSVCNWIWQNMDIMSGISLLPYDGGTYQQAPYIQISKEQFDAAETISIDWLSLVETEDATTGSQELACKGGACEL